MYQSGEISINECSKCREVFPVFILAANTDMVTNEPVALTGPNNSIILTMSKSGESMTAIENNI